MGRLLAESGKEGSASPVSATRLLEGAGVEVVEEEEEEEEGGGGGAGKNTDSRRPLPIPGKNGKEKEIRICRIERGGERIREMAEYKEERREKKRIGNGSDTEM